VPSRRQQQPLNRQSAPGHTHRHRGPGSEARSNECRGVPSTDLVHVPTSIKPVGRMCARGALGSGPDRLRRTGRGPHLHLHAEMVRREPDEGAVERDRVVWIADDRKCCRRGRSWGRNRSSRCPANRFAPRHGSTRELSCSAPPDRRAGRRDSRTQTVAARPSERAASIISMAKSRQLPWPSRSVSTGC